MINKFLVPRGWRIALFWATLLAVPLSQATELAGIPLEARLRVGGSELVLNGAGVRSKLFIKVYVGALYVGQKSSAANAIINQPGPRRMVLRMLRELDAETLQKALDEGLKNNHTAAELAAMKPQAEQLAAIMKGIGKAREGERIDIDCDDDGVVVALNGEARGKVAGLGFGRALLKVWLGDKPADADLKKALLGS